jgi:hypothetical protein
LPQKVARPEPGMRQARTRMWDALSSGGGGPGPGRRQARTRMWDALSSGGGGPGPGMRQARTRMKDALVSGEGGPGLGRKLAWTRGKVASDLRGRQSLFQDVADLGANGLASGPEGGAPASGTERLRPTFRRRMGVPGYRRALATEWGRPGIWEGRGVRLGCREARGITGLSPDFPRHGLSPDSPWILIGLGPDSPQIRPGLNLTLAGLSPSPARTQPGFGPVQAS